MAFTRRLVRSAAAVALAALCVIALPILSAAAAIVPVGSRAELGGNLTVNWDIYGPAGTETDSPDQRVVGPIIVSVASSGGRLVRVDGDGSFGFADGEPLLRDDFNTVESFVVGFNPPFVPPPSDSVVRGFGFELQSTASLGPFTGRAEVFDENSNLIGEIPFTGDTAGPPIFVGGLSDVANIGNIFIDIDNLPPFGNPAGAVAINRVDVVVVDQGVTSVPVPASWALLLAPLAGLALTARRRR